MKIKFVEGGYEKFTGHFGHVLFKDGVSVDNVSDADARLFASVTTIEVIGEGEIVGDNERYSGSMEVAAVSVNYLTLADVQAGQVAVEPGQVAVEVAKPSTVAYTQAQLEAVADKGGIAGLREIADPLDVKGTSIHKLIEGIMAKQAGAQPEAAPLAEGQPDVVTSEQAQ